MGLALAIIMMALLMVIACRLYYMFGYYKAFETLLEKQGDDLKDEPTKKQKRGKDRKITT